MTAFQRARQPEQKQERRVQLLHTARDMLGDGAGIRDLSLNELARQAGMAKSNVYRYFETREAVLLELLRQEWFDWYAAFSTSYRARKPSPSPLEALIRQIVRTLAARPLLCALTTALPGVLEQNLSSTAIYNFKLESLEFFQRVAAFMHECAAELSVAAYTQLSHDTVTLIAGLYPHARPSAAAEEALNKAELRFFRRDFARELERLMLAIARDLGQAKPGRSAAR